MPSSASPRFIGRRQELTTLTRLIAASRYGTAQVALVSGEAGIGKSRLIAEAVREARTDGHRVLMGGCISMQEQVAPLAPIAEAMRGLAADTPPRELERILGPTREVFAALLPGLAAGQRPELATGLMYVSGQERLSAHVVDLLTRLSRAAPLVLVVEDIHWADAATLQVLSLLVRNMRNAPFALIASLRSDEADPDRLLMSFVAELERLAHPEQVVLNRFSRGEVGEQIAAIAGGHAASDLLEIVLARSEGNPFYVEELLAADPTGGDMPATLQAVLGARLASLSGSASRLVAAAAVRGIPSTDDELGIVSGLDAEAASAAVHELLDRKIFERRRVAGREVLDFRHVLLQSAAYRDLLPGDRRRLHRRYAEMLEQQSDTEHDPLAVAELARHYEAAGDLPRALPAALKAGSMAEAARNSPLAGEQYERALRLLTALPAERLAMGLDRVDLLERAARYAAQIGSTRAIEHISRALEMVDAAAEPLRAGLLHERLGRYRWYAADGGGALIAYKEAVRLVPAEPRSVARARVTAGLAQLLMILARFDESTVYCREALANAQTVGDRQIEAHVMNTMGVNAACLGDIEGGLSLLRSSRAVAEELGSVEDIARAYANLVDVLMVAGRYRESADMGLQAMDLANSWATTERSFMLNYRAWALHHLASWPEAQAALELARQVPMEGNSNVMNMAVSAMVEAWLGRTGQAQAHLEIARPLMDRAIDTQLLLPHAEAEAELALWTGRPGVAVRAVMDAIHRAEPPVGGNVERYGPVLALGIRAVADIVAGATDEEHTVAEALAQAGRLEAMMSDTHALIKVRRTAHLHVAEPYMALCKAESARVARTPDPQAWARAAELLAGLGQRHRTAYARWREGEAHLARGHGAQAVAPLNDGYRIAVEIGAQPLRLEIERLARRGRVALTGRADREPAAPAARFGLTAREIEVLSLVAAGKTNHQIGQELFITDKTASVHVSNVLGKLGVARRAEAAAMALRLGIVEDRTPREVS